MSKATSFAHCRAWNDPEFTSYNVLKATFHHEVGICVFRMHCYFTPNFTEGKNLCSKYHTYYSWNMLNDTLPSHTPCRFVESANIRTAQVFSIPVMKMVRPKYRSNFSILIAQNTAAHRRAFSAWKRPQTSKPTSFSGSVGWKYFNTPLCSDDMVYKSRYGRKCNTEVKWNLSLDRVHWEQC